MPDFEAPGLSVEAEPKSTQGPAKAKKFFLDDLARTLIAGVVVTALCASSGCGGPERSAERIYREGIQAIEDDKLNEGVELLEQVIREYPGTESASRAAEDLKLYRGLVGAVQSYPVRLSTDRIIRTARALDRYRWRRGKYPESLEKLVPDYLSELSVDSWGRPLAYERRRGGRGYSLSSYGADGAPGGAGDDRDIVVENGAFVRR